MIGRTSVYAHPEAEDGIEVRRYHEKDSLPARVVVEVAPNVCVSVDEVAYLDGLITAAVEARDWLTAALASQERLPEEAA